MDNLRKQIKEVGKLILSEDNWQAFNDGYGIIGWGFYCDKCNKNNVLADFWKRDIVCEHCGAEYINTYDPDDEKQIT